MPARPRKNAPIGLSSVSAEIAMSLVKTSKISPARAAPPNPAPATPAPAGRPLKPANNGKASRAAAGGKGLQQDKVAERIAAATARATRQRKLTRGVCGSRGTAALDGTDRSRRRRGGRGFPGTAGCDQERDHQPDIGAKRGRRLAPSHRSDPGPARGNHDADFRLGASRREECGAAGRVGKDHR